MSGIAESQADLGDMEGLTQTLELPALKRNARGMVLVASRLARKGRIDLSKDLLNKAIELQPSLLDLGAKEQVLVSVARWQIEAKEVSAASATLAEAEKASTRYRNPEALCAIAVLQSQLGDKSGSQKTLDEALPIANSVALTRAAQEALVCEVVVAEYNIGNQTKASDILTGDDTMYTFHLSLSSASRQLESGAPVEGVEFFLKRAVLAANAIKGVNDKATALSEIAQVLISAKRPDLARVAIVEAYRTASQDPNAAGDVACRYCPRLAARAGDFRLANAMLATNEEPGVRASVSRQAIDALVLGGHSSELVALSDQIKDEALAQYLRSAIAKTQAAEAVKAGNVAEAVKWADGLDSPVTRTRAYMYLCEATMTDK